MAVTTYDIVSIINRIIQNLLLDTEIYNESGEDGKIPIILFGDPFQQNWLSQIRPYIAISPGEPFELSDEVQYVSNLADDSEKSRITLQFFITCAVDGTTPDDALLIDLKFRKLLKQFFKNNRRMKDPMGDNPLFTKSRTTITPKFIRNKMDIVSAFTVILQAEILSG